LAFDVRLTLAALSPGHKGNNPEVAYKEMRIWNRGFMAVGG